MLGSWLLCFRTSFGRGRVVEFLIRFISKLLNNSDNQHLHPCDICNDSTFFFMIQNASPITRDELHHLLSFLCALLVDARTSSDVIRLFRPILPVLLTILSSSSSSAPSPASWSSQSAESSGSYLAEDILVAMSTLLATAPHLQSAVLSFVQSTPPRSLLTRLQSLTREQILSDSSLAPHCLRIAQAAWRLLRVAGDAFASAWNWSPFLTLLEHADVRVRWYTAHAVAMLMQMNEHVRSRFVAQIIRQGDDETAQPTTEAEANACAGLQPIF
jgi:hypothetical protein